MSEQQTVQIENVNSKAGRSKKPATVLPKGRLRDVDGKDLLWAPDGSKGAIACVWLHFHLALPTSSLVQDQCWHHWPL